MKQFLLAICALMASLMLVAQDIIVTKDAKKIEAKILEVSKSEIKYKELDNLEGPTFILETNEINSIIYANGKVVLYNNQPEQEQPQEQSVLSTSNVAEANSYNTEIHLMSGQVIKCKIMEKADTYVGYTYNAKYFTMPATHIFKVVDLRTHKETIYNGQNLNQSEPLTTYTTTTSTTNTSTTNASSTNSNYSAAKTGNTPCYQGYLEFSGIFENADGIPAGGIAIDGMDGARLNKYAFIGLGVGLYAEFANYNGASASTLQTPIYADLRVFLPTKIEGFYPYLETSLGPMIHYYQSALFRGRRSSATSVFASAFFRLNAGIDYKRFSFGIGYELWGNNSAVSNLGFVKIGARIGKDIE